MRIVILSSQTAWHSLDLKRASGNRHEVELFPFDKLAASIDEDRNFNITADCVLVRTMPAGSLQQIVFRMDALAQLAAKGTLVLNSPKSIEMAVDKYLSLAKLAEAKIQVPRTCVSQDLDTALSHFRLLGSNSVVKPIFGSMGFGIKRVESMEQARTIFENLIDEGNVIYQQEFVEHDGFDIRLLVIGDHVIGMKRTNPDSWITNIAQGGIGQRYQPTDQECELAIKSARTVGAHFAGVDLVYDLPTNRQLVLEVNAVPGWRAISQVVDLDIAEMIVTEIEKLIL